MAIGLLLIFGPVVILVFTVYFLTLTGELLVGRLTLLELVELYLIELVLFAVAGYSIYWLTVKLVEHQPPASPDTAAETTEDASLQTDSHENN